MSYFTIIQVGSHSVTAIHSLRSTADFSAAVMPAVLPSISLYFRS